MRLMARQADAHRAAAGLRDVRRASVDGFIARIRQRRPKMLFGYPSAISHIARLRQKNRSPAG
jgi:hypothetical protein